MKFDDADGATVAARLNEYQQLKNNQQPWLEEGQQIAEWLLPGRGMFNIGSKPVKRVLTSSKIVNSEGKSAFGVFVSFLKEGITPSTRPWIDIKFRNKELRGVKELQVILAERKETLYDEMRRANFYNTVNSYYTEIVGFATGSMFVGEGDIKNPLQYSVLTFGEYSIGTDDNGKVDRLYRTVFMNFYQLYKKFGDNLPQSMLDKYEKKDGSLDYWYTVVEGVVPEKFMDMPFTRFYILLCEADSKYDGGVNTKIPKKNKYPEFLRVEGCNEFPYPTTRYDVIGTDEYGVSPSMEAIPIIKRLQEVVKSSAISFHKSIRPPLNAPVHMKGQVKTYPDAINYYINKEDIISKAYDTSFDHTSAALQEEKLEEILKKLFYNDVFLTASRDPNASPLKARQVEEISGERFVRLSPTLDRIFYEGIVPTVQRSYNILERKGKFTPWPEQFREQNIDVEIELTSILAQMMKAMTAGPLQNFLQIVGAIAQYKPEVMDIPDLDGFAYELADINGVPARRLNSPAQIASIRKNRQAELTRKEQKAEGAQDAMLREELNAQRASTTKDMSEAGANLSEQFSSEGMLL